MKSSACYFYMKTRILADFQICISVPLINSSHKQSNKQCVFCNLKNHKSYKCLRVTEPVARKQILKQNKNCFICFVFGSPKIVIGTINAKNAIDNTISVFVPFLITKEIDSTQMKKTMKILAQITSQPIREVFCCKLHILKFQTSVHKRKPKFVCYSIWKVEGPLSVMD